MNPFEILEITPGATPDEIKAAYHRLAKKWHPDRFKGAEKAEAEDRFRMLADAFNMLKDSARRPEVVAHLAKDSESQSTASQETKREPAAERSVDDWFNDAKEAFESRDYSRALGLVHYTIRLDGNRADTFILLAKLLDVTGGDKRSLVRALENAIRINPKDVESRIRLADTFTDLGMQAKANRIREEVRKIAPKHKTFSKEAATSAKKVSSSTAQEDGLLGQLRGMIGRLFKKG